MAKYFKKPSGIIIEATENHDLASLKDRFEECDANGKAIKKQSKKGKKGDKYWLLLLNHFYIMMIK